MRKVVVLPAPFGPSKPKISPRQTSKLIWSTAVKAPNLFTRSWASIMVSRRSLSARGVCRTVLGETGAALFPCWCNSNMKPSSNRAGVGWTSSPAVRHPIEPKDSFIPDIRTTRTNPPSGTASAMPGSSKHWAWRFRAGCPSGGSTKNTRPLASFVTSPGGPCTNTFPWLRTTT